MNRLSNFKNRFRILKGGKVSLVVSAMLLSSTVFVNEAKAVAGCNIGVTESGKASLDCKKTEMQTFDASWADFTITENGSIVIESGSNNIGIETSALSANKTITNNGIIKVNGENTSIGISTFAGMDRIITINNNGTIEAYKNGILDTNGKSISIASVLPYDVNVNNSGTLKGLIDGYIYLNLKNTGTVELPSGTFSQMKTFENESSGKLIIGLKTDGQLGAGTQYSKVLSGASIFKNGSTIDVNVLDSSTNVALLAGSKLTDVVTAGTNLTIDGKLNITDNSALLDFEYETTASNGEDSWGGNGEDGAIHLKAVKATEPTPPTPPDPKEPVYKTILSSTIAGNGNQNDQNAAKSLQSLYDSNPEVASAFNKLPTDSSIARAVESTTPQTTNATVGAATQISNGISTIVTQRQNANISNSGLNSGDGMFSENNLWIKPFGSIGKQNSKDGINGFDLKTYGLGFGADTEIKDNSKLGLAFFYTNASVDTNNVNQKADLDVYTALVYGNIPIIDDKTNFLYQAGYSWQKTDTNRDLFTGENAEAKYTSKIASLDLKLMRDFQISDSLLLQPLVNTTYRHFTNPNYSESGAGALNLNVDKFTTSELIVGLGTLAHYKLTEDSKIIGSVNVGYDLQDKKQMVTSAYQGNIGTSFDTNGIDNGRWSYEAGIGYELDINKTNNINISYDYQGQGSKFSNNVISAKYTLKF
ncbi:autotransporter domain-containing protein [Aliarcobacter vitoriensis]|uniref:autotransporter family protein n=1 Tax=Aliarcobacter vitoriensis TaxID=2011099 RepID=UPI003AAFE10A